MVSFYKKSILAIVLTVILLQLAGCGETLQGVGKDWGRVGKGIKTIFIKDSD